jgi:hypothetical protein
MIITPSANGWSYDDSVGKWKLAYEEKTIIFYQQTDQSIATPQTLFVGTHEECEDQIKLLNLKFSNEQNGHSLI